ncbi:transposase [Natronococcus pandeyae]|uniref:Transposase n=1 Tax=Natronococcus pandeyae TaxID=2055836 RepID=A0A8J8Q2E9_9EURY|nr:RNA-guided endonuclease TnpB family protein [Natronococcus pandeyae]TYL37188.1 transposase [Natronococcus pandeyae]
MKRANTFEVRPLSPTGEEILRRLLDASAALWNETNYQRLIRYTDDDGYEDDDVWDADTGALEGRYKSVLGASTAQQVIRQNTHAWQNFFRAEAKYYDESNATVTEKPNPPGFRGNKDDGRELKTVIRNTSYSIDWGERSRLELLIGQDLKDEYDHTGRLRLEVCGEPNWPEYESQGRLNVQYDEVDGVYRASQPVTLSDDIQATPLADETAALDIGANNLVACTTTTGKQYLYSGRNLFRRFRETTRRIAELQSKLEDGQYSSKRIRHLYRKRTERRDHAQDALCRDLVERLYEEGVSEIYVGGLTDVLETHWSVETNAKTHNFWAFAQFVKRVTCTAEEYGVGVNVRSEAWTSRECPNCGSREETTRHRDTMTCVCGFEGHADLVASRTFLERQTGSAVRLMAQPERFEWDDHSWSESPCSRESPKELRSHQSTTRKRGNVAPEESAEPRLP